MCKLDSSLLQADGGLPLLGEDGVLLPEHTPQLVGAAAGEDGEAGVVDAPPKGGMSFSPQGTAAWLGLFDPVRVSTTPTRITADSRRILYVVDSSVGAKSIDLTNEAETLGLLPGFAFAFKRNGGSNVGFDLSATTDTIDGATYLVLGSDGDFAVVVYLGSGLWTALVGTAGAAATPTGRLLARYVYTTGTGATHTPSASADKLRIVCVGGGGGGGGADQAGAQAGVGGGGGSGGITEVWWTPSGNITYSVGAAGIAGIAGNNAGGNGGDTTASGTGLALTAKGGQGGSSMAAGTGHTAAPGGVLNSGTTGGDIDVATGVGRAGVRQGGTLGIAGDGAPCGNYGHGGAGGAVNNAGGNASGYGAGGGGAHANGAGGVDKAGGTGGGGLIIIEEYS